MKYSLAILSLLYFFSACASLKQKENIDSVESEMIIFLQETLKTNYGNKNALCLFVQALERYHFNYLLDVDKDRLKRINEKLYTGGILYSYFLDEAILNDSCMLFVPAGVSPSEYRRSDVCRQALRKLQVKDSCSVVFIVDSAKYVYSKAQVENILLPLKKREDGFTYWQREFIPLWRQLPRLKMKLEGILLRLCYLGWSLIIRRIFVKALRMIGRCKCF